eukprot:TRINITY_DN21650_c0_g1_i2.p1 TRINITY_DN21650_c0_g1~~TRINITY_DN21650_c0_g1_i2.p1  ORF type:complete len:380 (+),score=75.71 TRINITY_DN21650_c0_g1_i2:76-1215(+)
MCIRDSYDRLWCVYEIFHGARLGIPVHAAMLVDADFTCNASPLKVSTRNAVCGSPADELAIRNEITSSGGYLQMDRVISKMRFQMLEERGFIQLGDMCSAPQATPLCHRDVDWQPSCMIIHREHLLEKLARFQDDSQHKVAKDVWETVQIEVHMMSQSRHPRLADCVCEDGKIAVELCLSGNLNTYIECLDQPLSAEQVHLFALEAAQAVAFMQSQRLRVVGFGPSRLLVDNEGHLKFSNCGGAVLAALSNAFSGAEDASQLAGDDSNIQDLRYLAPEEFSSRVCDSRSVVYRFGLLLYKLLGRECPWTGIDKVLGICMKVVNGTTPEQHHPLDPAVVTANPVLVDVMRRCLQTDEGIRPTIAEVLELLEDGRDGAKSK